MKKLEKGIFIVLEGGEGTGKTTQQHNIAVYLRSLGYSVLTTREPGGGDPKYREKLLNPDHPLTPTEELDIFCMDRHLHVKHVIRPALERGEVVVCDRFYYSSIAYQGYGRGLDMLTVLEKVKNAAQGCEPNCILLFDGNPEKMLPRVKDPNRFEAEGMPFHQRVRQGFLDQARHDPNPRRWEIINAEFPLETVSELALAAVASQLQ